MTERILGGTVLATLDARFLRSPGNHNNNMTQCPTFRCIPRAASDYAPNLPAKLAAGGSPHVRTSRSRCRRRRTARPLQALFLLDPHLPSQIPTYARGRARASRRRRAATFHRGRRYRHHSCYAWPRRQGQGHIIYPERSGTANRAPLLIKYDLFIRYGSELWHINDTGLRRTRRYLTEALQPGPSTSCGTVAQARGRPQKMKLLATHDTYIHSDVPHAGPRVCRTQAFRA